MKFYLISFPSEAMQLSAEEFQEAVVDSHAVVEEAKAAGVYVFGGGIDEEVAPITVTADGTITEGASSPQTARIDGGFTVLKLDSREQAEEWAARIAKGCHCPQELREFMFDPAS